MDLGVTAGQRHGAGGHHTGAAGLLQGAINLYSSKNNKSNSLCGSTKTSSTREHY